MMYEQILYLFVAIGDGIITQKSSMGKYVFAKPNRVIFTYDVDIMFQYFLIFLNSLI